MCSYYCLLRCSTCVSHFGLIPTLSSTWSLTISSMHYLLPSSLYPNIFLLTPSFDNIIHASGLYLCFHFISLYSAPVNRPHAPCMSAYRCIASLVLQFLPIKQPVCST